jgi:hypothetical protein
MLSSKVEPLPTRLGSHLPELQRYRIPTASYTSTNRGEISGYQLITQSPSIDLKMKQELTRWCASSSTGNEQSWQSFNYHPLGEKYYVFSRTFLGPAEYSGRGNRQISTKIILLTEKQFASFDFLPTDVLLTALTLGLLKFSLTSPYEDNEIDFPTFPLHASLPKASPLSRDAKDEGAPETTNQLVHALTNQQRCAVVSSQNPLEQTKQIFAQLDDEQRRRTSFTTGLPYSRRRPFCLQLFKQLTLLERRRLKSQSIHLYDNLSVG